MAALHLKKLLKRVSGFFLDAPVIATVNTGSSQRAKLSPEKRQKIEALCKQLLSRQEIITSGKVQFVGLEQVKKRMGKKWAGLSSFVYEITEEVISKHVDKSDLFLGYKDDTYVIIFIQASLEEAKEKTAAITNEIRERLFTLDEDQLKRIEIRNSAQRVKSKSFLEEMFPEAESTSLSQDMLFTAKGEKISSLYSDKIDVGAEDYKTNSSSKALDAANINNLSYMYIPLWEVRRAALTTYICLPALADSEKKSFFAYHELYANKTKEQQVQLDIKTLKYVLTEIAEMEKDGRKLYIACPVRYETLQDFASYEIYKETCQTISENAKQFLIFVVINSENTVPAKDPYWFINPLKSFCSDLFLEVPLKHDTNFQLLKMYGADTVGVHLNRSQMSEQDNIGISNSFSSKAKYFKIQKTFALDVSTLSATTSLVCAGFDYIGGSAIHEDVAKPDTIHRYRYEDLLSEMTKPAS